MVDSLIFKYKKNKFVLRILINPENERNRTAYEKPMSLQPISQTKWESFPLGDKKYRHNLQLQVPLQLPYFDLTEIDVIH